ncbi:MAG: DUF4080 domain-containing protein [Lysobacterales bacterium]
MSAIVLSTLNARYAHASLGLRYLLAGLGELRPQTSLREFVIGSRTEELVEAILAEQPQILGLGVYIWNVEESTRLVAQLKLLAPELIIVLGGPEVSYEIDDQRIGALADYVITGWGETSFAELARALLAGERPDERIIAGKQPPLDQLALPYDEYDATDIAQRHLYVEASRGCPFKCEFCLSSLDRTAWPFPLDAFLDQLRQLWARGARQYKFVDRTFNLKVDTSAAILDFFLERIAADPADPPFVHFELIPDHLPERLKQLIARFPAGTLQFEIGIQSFNPEVQARISRRQKNELAATNLRWLRQHSQAHLHVDLIAGLPGEDIASFAAGFDQLVALGPQEIQFGILKRLRGTPIIRHTNDYGLRFNPDPPYNVLATDAISFAEFQRLARFARYWDLLANSGRFRRSLPLLLAESPFAQFLAFSDWLYTRTRRTHGLAQDKLVEWLREFLLERDGGDSQSAVDQALIEDYRGSGGRARLSFDDGPAQGPRLKQGGVGNAPARQRRHLV